MQELHMTTIELNNSYYLIITYFLRKLLSPFKLILLLKVPRTFFFQSFQTRIWFFFPKFKIFSSKVFFLVPRIFLIFSKNFPRRIFVFFERWILSFFTAFSWYFQTSKWAAAWISKPFLDHLLILEKRYSKILHHRSATRFINMISRPERSCIVHHVCYVYPFA